MDRTLPCEGRNAGSIPAWSTMQKETKEIIKFTELLIAFQRTERSVMVPGTDRFENDAEHSYLLATLGWYLIDTLGLDLDKKKVFEAALSHDLVEVYAQDTPAFSHDEKIKSSKTEREQDARKKIIAEFPKFTGLHDAMEKYEKRSDKENSFVYALDKLAPILCGFCQDGRDWKRQNISFEQVFEYKRDKIMANEHVYRLFEEIMAHMDKDRKKYFNI